jgi:hypothetical protein
VEDFKQNDSWEKIWMKYEKIATIEAFGFLFWVTFIITNV